MKASRSAAARAFLLSTAMVCGLVLTGCAASGIKVLVVNKSGGPVNAMKVSYTGGSMTIPRLENEASYTGTIKVTAVSDVDVELSLASGEKKTQSIRAQLEPKYVGDLRLEITPTGGIGWDKQLALKRGRGHKGSMAKEPQPQPQ